MDKADEIPNQTPSPSPIPSWDLLPDAPEITYNWIDVSDEMGKACCELNLGELVHEPNFGLFEAMSAIEMMDPKMDAGMVGKQTKRKVLNFKQAIESGSIKISNLTFSELIGIADFSLCCLLSWLEGQSLAQTVFTCLYLHEPDLIEDRYLRAYCLCLLKLCDTIREKVNQANVFEEEDFQTLSYGFKFADNLTDMRVIGMMKEVEDELSRKLRNLKSEKQIHNEELLTEMELCDGFLARIKLLRVFLQVVMNFGKKEMEYIQITKKLLHQMVEHLGVIDRTAHLGIDAVQSDDGHMIMHGFEPLVNQKLLPPTFPRYTTLRSQTELKEKYREIVDRIHGVTEVTSLLSYDNVLEFMDKFGRTVPCVFSRSLLQLAFLPANRYVLGQQLMTECVRESVRAFNAPPVFSMRCPNFTNLPSVKVQADLFLSRAARTATALVQVYGHNRARHREKLAAILEDFSSLQDEADRIDAELHYIYQTTDAITERSHLTCLGSWTLYYTLKVMTQYLLSGFELELYSAHEFHYIYWYLAEVLLSWLITTLNRAETQLMKDEALGEQQSQVKGRSSKKNKRNKKKGKTHSKELTLMQAMQMMAAGCFKSVLGFFLCEKLKNPDFILDSEGTRYEHRFLPFVNISTPPFMLYSQFNEMTDVSQYYPPPTAEDLYLSASKHFTQAKSLYESITNPSDEVNKLTKVAKTNMIVTKLLAGGHRKESKARPDFDFSVHQYFPVFKIA